MSSITNTNQAIPSIIITKPSTLPDSIQNVLEEFFPGRSSQIIATPLKGNSVYKITLGDQNYVLRQSYPTWTEWRRQKEIEIAKWIAQAGAGPQVHKVSQDYVFMLLEYFNGGTMDPDELIDLKEIALCLRNLHSIGIPPSQKDEKRSMSFIRLDGQVKMIQKHFELPGYLSKMYTDAQKLEQKMNENMTDRSLCHMDLHCHNIMRHDGHMYLVDYGMTGSDHPMIDLANFSMYMQLTVEQENILLAHYFGHEPTDQEKEQYAIAKPIVYLNKVTWGLIAATKLGATSELVDQVFKGEERQEIMHYFRQIYAQVKREDPKEWVKYAHEAYKFFYQYYPK